MNDELLYGKVIRVITEQIEQGILKPGDKLPSLRKLSGQLDVSIATVVQAYSILENDGMIQSRERSGFVVLPKSLPEIAQPTKTAPSLISKPVTINDVVLLTAEVANNPDYVPLGAATLSPELFPLKDLRRITAAVARDADEWGYFYEFVPGNEALIAQLARASLGWGCALGKDDFVITCGAMEALQLALRVVAKPGDTIAVESPTFYPILQSLENLNMNALEIPTDPKEGIDLDVLEFLLKRNLFNACVLIPNFNNPLGYLMPDDNKRRLVKMLAEKGIPLIEDDIYADLHFEGSRPKPLKAYDEEGLVLLCSSFSKTLCSGYRVGWIAPGRFMEDIKRMKYYTNVSAPTLPQLALAECLKTGIYEKHIAGLRSLFRNQRQYYIEAIAKSFPEGTKVTFPQGGFLFWLELPESFDALKLYKTSIAQGISIAPGPMFSAAQDYRNCIRLNGGHRWSSKIESTIEQLGLMAHHCL